LKRRTPERTRLHKDLRAFSGLLNSNEVEYLLVGGYALAFHGVPRYTGGIDILLRNTAENAARLEHAIAAFGFAALGLAATDFLQPDCEVQFGLPPNRIDLLTSITGVGFDEAWAGREPAELDGLPVAFIGRLEFARN
jgi:hypothetical protein